MIEVEPSVDSRHECADTLIRVGEDLLRVSSSRIGRCLLASSGAQSPQGAYLLRLVPAVKSQ